MPNSDDHRIEINSLLESVRNINMERTPPFRVFELNDHDELIVTAVEEEPTSLQGRQVLCFNEYHRAVSHRWNAWDCIQAERVNAEGMRERVNLWWQERQEARRQAEDQRRERDRLIRQARDSAVFTLGTMGLAAYQRLHVRIGQYYRIGVGFAGLTEELARHFNDDAWSYQGFTVRVEGVNWSSARHPDTNDYVEYPLLHVSVHGQMRYGYPVELSINPLTLERQVAMPAIVPGWPADLARRGTTSRRRDSHHDERTFDLGDGHREYDSDLDRMDDHAEDCEGGCPCCACACGYQPYDSGESSSSLINGYSYRPQPRFHGDGPVFLGAELELDTRHGNTDRLAHRVLTDWGQERVYLKHDGSVRGFEVVSHPMTYDYWTQNMALDVMSDWYDMGARPDESCGLHIHVSRDAFSNPVHQFKWMKLFYRNRSLVEHVARRRDSSYARFSSHDNKHARYMKHYAKGGIGGERYQAINAGNEHTFEVRVFASTLSAAEFRASLALVDASVEYSRQLSTQDIIRNNGWSEAAFTRYVNDAGKYGDLAAMLAERQG